MAVGDIVGGPLTGTDAAEVLIGTAREGNFADFKYDNAIDMLLGNGGNDVIVGDLFDSVSFNTEGDEIHGGEGDDIIYGDTAPDLSGFNQAYVGDTNWSTHSGGAGDFLYGDGGNDIIYGSGGQDTLYGGTGDDQLNGQNDGDDIYGGDDVDRISGGGGIDIVYGGAGADIISGGGDNDTLYGEEIFTGAGDGDDTIRGDAGDDKIGGGVGADRLSGGSGNDEISGGGRNGKDLGDTIDGGTGNDLIYGDEGDDRITGGAGLDTLTGGTGMDQFIYKAVGDSSGANTDIITDFNDKSSDRISLRLIDANPATLVDDAFTLISGTAFTGAGQIMVTRANGSTFIKINTDTDQTAEMTIQLYGLHTLDKADFIL